MEWGPAGAKGYRVSGDPVDDEGAGRTFQREAAMGAEAQGQHRKFENSTQGLERYLWQWQDSSHEKKFVCLGFFVLVFSLFVYFGVFTPKCMSPSMSYFWVQLFCVGLQLSCQMEGFCLGSSTAIIHFTQEPTVQRGQIQTCWMVYGGTSPLPHPLLFSIQEAWFQHQREMWIHILEIFDTLMCMAKGTLMCTQAQRWVPPQTFFPYIPALPSRCILNLTHSTTSLLSHWSNTQHP